MSHPCNFDPFPKQLLLSYEHPKSIPTQFHCTLVYRMDQSVVEGVFLRLVSGYYATVAEASGGLVRTMARIVSLYSDLDPEDCRLMHQDTFTCRDPYAFLSWLDTRPFVPPQVPWVDQFQWEIKHVAITGISIPLSSCDAHTLQSLRRYNQLRLPTRTQDVLSS